MARAGRLWHGPAAALLLLCSCAGTPPTAADREAILNALQAYERHVELGVACLNELTVSGDRAVTEYRALPLHGSSYQFPSYPMRAELTRDGDTWTVTRRKTNWPWWWEVLNRTVGVK